MRWFSGQQTAEAREGSDLRAAQRGRAEASAAVGAMAGQQGRLSQRLAAFKQRFGQILGPKQHGYGELGQLEQPLVGHAAGGASDTSDSAYFQQHGVPRPGAQAPPPQYAQQGSYAGAAPGGAAPPNTATGVPVAPVPDQVRWSPCLPEGPCLVGTTY